MRWGSVPRITSASLPPALGNLGDGQGAFALQHVENPSVDAIYDSMLVIFHGGLFMKRTFRIVAMQRNNLNHSRSI